jgi:hypothetical protein
MTPFAIETVPAPAIPLGMTPLQNFLSRVETGLQALHATDPHARLLWVEGVSSQHAAHGDADVDFLRVRSEGHETSARWTDFGPARSTPPLIGLRALPDLARLRPLADAIQELCGLPFLRLTLKWPLTPAARVPIYEFEMLDRTRIAVRAL